MVAAWIGSITFLAVVVLYVLLALGMPYGSLAMGGKYQIMPKQMRVTLWVSVVIQLIAIVTLLQTGNVISTAIPQGIVRGVCYVFAVYLVINTVMNILSKSRRERLVMTPLSLVTAICFWVTAIKGGH